MTLIRDRHARSLFLVENFYKNTIDKNDNIVYNRGRKDKYERK